MNDGPVHYGPVYGGKVGESLALCKPGLLPNGSNSMSRSISMVYCQHCRMKLEEILEAHFSGSRRGDAK